MTERTTIDMVDLSGRACGEGATLLYEDDYFARYRICHRVDGAVEVNVLTDCIRSQNFKCLYISVNSSEDRTIEFAFSDAKITSHGQGSLVTDGDNGGVFHFPPNPSLREYDDEGRMLSSVTCSFDISSENSGAGYASVCKSGSRLELAAMCFQEKSELIYEELTEFTPLETKPAVKEMWFRYDGIGSVWDYLINGMIYSTRHLGRTKAWNSQNLAQALYSYLEYLGTRTGKHLYGILRDLIAYSVMLSLDEEGRWRHGIWTDLMETHMVHQASGVHILLLHYEDTGNGRFLEKARVAGEYLLCCVDRLKDAGVWFLHDSLEENIDDVRLHYKDLTVSNAFGKSESNTLTLNSHVWTLAVLERLNSFGSSEKYQDAIAAGFASLRRVLEARPFSIGYGIVYGVRDILLKLTVATKSRLFRKIQIRYENLLMRSILPRLKKRFPRIVMPNGFTARDLCFAHLSNFYHLTNIKVLLILYSQSHQDWMSRAIRESTRYTIKSGIARYMAVYGSRAVVALEVLLMYSALFDDGYLRHLAEYVKYFEKLNVPFQIDLVADRLVANPSVLFASDSSDVVILAPAEGKKFVAVVVSLVDNDVRTTVTPDSEDASEAMELVDMQNNRYPLGQEVTVPGGGYLKVVRKNGQS